MATIKDIADEVGISKAAVSRIVERVAHRLKYTLPSASQQEDVALSKVIAAIFPVVELPYFGLVASLLEKRAYSYGYNLMLCGSLFDRHKEEECFKSLQEKKISGIILGSYTKDITMLENQNLPVVTLGYKLADTIPSVCADNYAAGKIAARHLLSKGCRKLLYITSYQEGLERDLRYKGFADELHIWQLAPWVYQVNMKMQLSNDFSEIITQMALDHPDADGVFAETDALAMNCLQVFPSLGYRIPQDIKVVGYGNPFFSAFSNPKLTIVRENTEEIARRAVSLLVDLIENDEERENLRASEIIVPVSLNEQKTT